MANILASLSQMSEKDRDAFHLVRDFYWNSKNNRADIERKWDDFLAMYNAYREKPKGPDGVTRSRIGTSIGYTSVETSVAKLRGNILPDNPNDPMIKVMPRGPEDVERADNTEAWLQFSLERVGHRQKIEKAARDYNIYGITVAYPKWKFVTAKRKLRTPITDNGRVVGLGDFEMQEQLIADYPDFEIGDIRSFYPDSSAEEFTPDKMRAVVREIYIPYDELKLAVESDETGIFNKKNFKLIDPASLPSRVNSRTHNNANRITSYQNYTPDGSLRKVEGLNGFVRIWEYWSKDKWIMIADEVLPLINTDSELWSYQIPVIISVRQPRSGYPWGKSVLEPVEKIISHIDGLRNASLDQINKALHPPMLLKKGSGINKQQLVNIGPYDIIDIINREDIDQMKFDDVTTGAFRMEDTLLADYNNANANISGVGGGNSPANVRSGVQQFSQLELVEERNKADIDNFAESFVLPLGRFFVEYAQLYMTRPEIVRLTDDPNASIKVVRPFDLISPYDLKPATSARVLPKAVEANQRLIFVQNVERILANPQGVADQIIKMWADAAGDLGYKKIERVLLQLIPEFTGRRLLADDNLLPGIGNGQDQATSGAVLGGANTDVQNTPQSQETTIANIENG